MEHPVIANGLENWTLACDFEESQIKRKGKGKGGGQFASKGGGQGKKPKPKQARPSSAGHGPAEAKASPQISPEIHAHVAEYRKIFPQTWKRFESTMKQHGKVSGRVKSTESVSEKLSGRYAGKPLSAVDDMIGMRCTTESVAEVYKSVDEVKSNFKIIELDDKMPKGQGFYRAVHLIVDSLDETGEKRAEIQCRTARQSNIAQWGHDVAYKGRFAKDPVVQAYAKQVSDAAWELDNGREASFPDAPEILKQHGLDYQPDRKYEDHWLAKEKPEFLK
jgi:ppGpp synthetase/RelA/SpoT-type nucleotidyltranferase